MSASYLDPRADLDPATRTVRAEFSIRNDSPDTWKAAEGFSVGYHLFDADTTTLIVDGSRVPLERDLGPGESARVRVTIEVPPEDGRFQAIISPMLEGVCWYYDQGWPFLQVECSTESGITRVDRTRVIDRERLRRERELRAIGRAFIYPVRSVWRNRTLIRVMVRRDILGRYRGSFGGALWTILNPLLLMLTYFFVFGEVLRDPKRPASEFALYFLCGMLPWLAFSEAAGRAPSVILENRNFVKKLVFAVETLPVNLVVSGLVTESFAVVLYCGFLLALRRGIPAAVLWLPLLLIPQVLFTAGISWFLAGLGAFVRDMGQFIGFILTVWFFITPICYPEEMLMARAPWLSKNPMFVLVKGYRTIFLEHQHPAFGALWKFSVVAVVVFVLGYAWFYKLRKSFADMI